MNKYIRVSEDDREYLTTYQEHCEEVAALQDGEYDFEGCILKSSNNLKDLIDELIIDNPDNWQKKPFVYEGKWENVLNKEHAEYQKEHYVKTFGAIWVQLPNGAWELDPVAQMNDKGELELL